ncbi:unnamed protein product, partial [Amoebophrya sp. A25]
RFDHNYHVLRLGPLKDHKDKLENLLLRVPLSKPGTRPHGVGAGKTISIRRLKISFIHIKLVPFRQRILKLATSSLYLWPLV